MANQSTAILEGNEAATGAGYSAQANHRVTNGVSTAGEAIWSGAPALAMSGTTQLTLSALAGVLADANPVNVATLQGLLIVNKSATAVVQVGPSTVQPVVGLFLAATDRAVIPPGGHYHWAAPAGIAIGAGVSDQLDLIETSGTEAATLVIGVMGATV